ncbi:hypothetical protein IAD21_05294 [Abditibacteriota bacterium]|nr:hypothetical protein IAD21_05294 [Abditibacteriota bacterium]
MNIGTSTKKLAVVAGMLAVCSLGFLVSSASARPRQGIKEVRRTHTTVIRKQPVLRTERTVRTRTIVKTQPVVRTRVIRTPPVVRTRVIHTPPVVRTRTIVRKSPNYDNRNRYVAQRSTYNGRVTYVSGGRFGINVGGNVFNVYASSGLPRSLSRGDYVGVVGVRSNSTIRSSRVYITRNY